MYAMGDFEHALVSYHKANSVSNLLMKEREEIVEGIRKSEDAINKVLNDSKTFQNINDCIKNLGSSFLNLPLYEFKTVLLNIRTSAGSRRNSGQQTGRNLSNDIEYIARLMTKLQVLDTNEKITREADSALNYLADRKEFWSQHHV